MTNKTDIQIDINEARPVHYIATTGKHFLRPGTQITCYDDTTQPLQWEGIIQSCHYNWRENHYLYEILLTDKPYAIAQ